MQPSDKELDKLIREAASQFEADNAVPNWEGMKVLLEEQLPVKEEPRKRPFVFLILVIVLLGGGYLYFNHDETGKDNSSASKKPVAGKDGKSSPANTPGKMINSSAVEKQTVKNISDKLASTRSVNIAQSYPIRKKDLLQNNTSGRTRFNTSMGEVSENDLPNSKTVVTDTGESGFDTSPQPVSPGEGQSKNDITLLPEKKDDTIILQPETGTLKTGQDKVEDTGKITPGKKIRKNDTKKRPWEISLIYAPELTTIKLSNFDKPGSNYGILIGYTIFKNTSIQTGISRSRKNYTANGDVFKSNYWVSPPYKLKSVTGYCNIYEVPLNIKYQLSRGKKINISAFAGISSYFMTSEYYTYLYKSNYSSYTWSKNYNTQKNYWFSVATVGIGFEKLISKKINLGATPFVKIPFKGLGTGDLKLLTTGINFSLSYRP